MQFTPKKIISSLADLGAKPIHLAYRRDKGFVPPPEVSSPSAGSKNIYGLDAALVYALICKFENKGFSTETSAKIAQDIFEYSIGYVVREHKDDDSYNYIWLVVFGRDKFLFKKNSWHYGMPEIDDEEEFLLSPRPDVALVIHKQEYRDLRSSLSDDESISFHCVSKIVADIASRFGISVADFAKLEK